MRVLRVVAVVLVSVASAVAPTGNQLSRFGWARAQAPQGPQPQIPSLQVCNQTLARGEGQVSIASRMDTLHTGTFVVRVDLRCDPAGTGYPAGKLDLTSLSMSDSAVR